MMELERQGNVLLVAHQAVLRSATHTRGTQFTFPLLNNTFDPFNMKTERKIMGYGSQLSKLRIIANTRKLIRKKRENPRNMNER